jgi:hypothetical protein
MLFGQISVSLDCQFPDVPVGKILAVALFPLSPALPCRFRALPRLVHEHLACLSATGLSAPQHQQTLSLAL